MQNNHNLEYGKAICSFSFGVDRIFVFTVPDENCGFISGWIFLFNCRPYYCSIAGGSEGLSDYIADCYAAYLGEVEGSHGNLKFVTEPSEASPGYWELDDDTFLEFNDAFETAMTEAGYEL